MNFVQLGLVLNITDTRSEFLRLNGSRSNVSYDLNFQTAYCSLVTLACSRCFLWNLFRYLLLLTLRSILPRTIHLCTVEIDRQSVKVVPSDAIKTDRARNILRASGVRPFRCNATCNVTRYIRRCTLDHAEISSRERSTIVATPSKRLRSIRDIVPGRFSIYDTMI